MVKAIRYYFVTLRQRSDLWENSPPTIQDSPSPRFEILPSYRSVNPILAEIPSEARGEIKPGTRQPVVDRGVDVFD